MLDADENKPMVDADESKPVAKSGQRKRKAEQQSGKAGQRNRKSAQEQSAKPDQLQDAQEQVAAPVTPIESWPIESTPIDTSEIDTSAMMDTSSATSAETIPVAAAEAIPVAPAETVTVASAETVTVGFQAIANAYEDYTRKSLEQAKFFFENLAGVRSLDKAFELQADFVKQACETFISDSQKIRELHRDLARQRLAHLEGVVAKMTQTALPSAPHV
jgi:hypothetical protein